MSERLEDLKKKISKEKIPSHIAIIMDGNGRWAKTKGKFRIFGHRNGVKSVREVTEGAAELGVSCLTLYAFSTENWNRPKAEVNALMELLVNTIEAELPTLNKNGIRLQTIGDTESLPEHCRKVLQEGIQQTAGNKHMDLVLALSYSSKWDLVRAIRNIAAKVHTGAIAPENIDESMISASLSTGRWTHPELLIRTSGEHRISNFLLWELAYAEFYFTEKLWPDFRKEDLFEAIIDFQNRERRFGKTSEQLSGTVQI